MWCDASSIATGVVLEINNVKVEDAAWLRKKVTLDTSMLLSWILC